MTSVPQSVMTEHYNITYKPEFNAQHRGLRFTGVLEPHRAIAIDGVLETHRAIAIDGVYVVAVLIKDRWFIVAASAADDHKFEDIGPFPTPELAYVVMKLGAN